MNRDVKDKEYFNFATDILDPLTLNKDRTALVWADHSKIIQRFSFREVQRRSNQVAAALQNADLQQGDRVAVVVGREPAWWFSLIGIIRAGMVAVPGTPLLTTKDLQYRMEAARIKAIITDEPTSHKVDEIRADCPLLRAFFITQEEKPHWQSLNEIFSLSAPVIAVRTRVDAPCLLYFTSGTTGAPKMVLHSQVSYPLAHETTGKLWLDLNSKDLHWNLSDTGWAKAAWSSLFGPWSQGASVFVQESKGKFDPNVVLSTLRQHPITTFCAPPTAFRQLVSLDIGAKPLHLRHVVSAGEPLNPEVIEKWESATGLKIHEGYGQTETTILIGNFKGNKIKHGSMGVPAPEFQVELLDDNLNPLPTNVEGEIAVRVNPVRPMGLFVEYLDAPEENHRKFRGDYYLTGDRATRDEEGYFWFAGRNDDVIKSSGYRIGPFEVESALIEHPSVLEAAVIGVPDPLRHQIVKAFVVLQPGWTASSALAIELQDHVKKATAPYKYPREIEFVSFLPKTVSGKIKRVELRESSK